MPGPKKQLLNFVHDMFRIKGQAHHKFQPWSLTKRLHVPTALYAQLMLAANATLSLCFDEATTHQNFDFGQWADLNAALIVQT